MKTNLCTVAVSLVTVMLLVGCNSSSSSSSNGSDDNGESGGSTDVSAVCDTNVDLASDGEGVGSEGYDGLRFYRTASSLCAFDASQGVAFTVDENSDDIMQLVVTSYSRSGDELASDGVIFAANDNLWFADSEASAASVSPTQISSEDDVGSIDQMFFAPDYASASNGSLVYRKDANEWFAVQRDFGASSEPVAFGAGREPIGPFYDGDQLTHWIVRDGTDLIIVDVGDVSSRVETIAENVVLPPSYVGMFEDGTAVLAVSGEFKFLRPDQTDELVESSGPHGSLASGLSGLGFEATRGMRIDDVMYLALQEDNTARLVRIDLDSLEVEQIDQAASNRTTPVLVVANEDFVAWGWSNSNSDDGTSGVYLLDRPAYDREPIYEEGEDVSITTQVPANLGDWVFFNTTDRDDSSKVDARYAPLESNPSVDEISDARWQGATLDVSDSKQPVFVPEVTLDTVLLIDRDGDEQLEARDASDPSESTLLGTLPAQDVPGASQLPPRLLTAETIALGSARLLTYVEGISTKLVYVDTAHSESLKELGDIDSISVVVQGGF